MPFDGNTKSEVEIIDEAVRLLRTRGWTKGTLQDDRGALCMNAAISLADGKRHDEPYHRYGSAADRVVNRVNEIAGGSSDVASSICRFNNADTTDFDAVMDVFARARASFVKEQTRFSLPELAQLLRNKEAWPTQSAWDFSQEKLDALGLPPAARG